jgi:hypothetical protein
MPHFQKSAVIRDFLPQPIAASLLPPPPILVLANPAIQTKKTAAKLLCLTDIFI